MITARHLLTISITFPDTNRALINITLILNTSSITLINDMYNIVIILLRNKASERTFAYVVTEKSEAMLAAMRYYITSTA